MRTDAIMKARGINTGEPYPGINVYVIEPMNEYDGVIAVVWYFLFWK